MARISRKGAACQTAAAPAERIWKTAVYARLSLEDSGRKGANTIETQIELVSSYIKQCSYLSLTDTYIDNGESGKDFNRPSWNRLMDDIRAGRIDCVCVKDLSRFSRNYIETCEFLEKIFPFMDVRFISINDGYDNHAPGDKNEGLLIALKALINNQYLKDISRKSCAAKRVRMERGEHMGFAPFGYKKTSAQKGKLIPDEETAPIVRQIFEWRAEGLGSYVICKRLQEMNIVPPIIKRREKYGVNKSDLYKATVWRTRAIKTMVGNRVYIGCLEQGRTRQALYENKPAAAAPRDEWYITENAHEPLVSLELWEAANEVSRLRREEYFNSHKPPELPPNLFKGFLVCGACKAKLTRRHSIKTNKNGTVNEYFSYYCAISRQHSESPAKSTGLKAIYNAVFPMVAKRLSMAANLGAIIEKRAKRQKNPRALLDAEIARVSRELETVTQRRAGLYEDYVDKLLNETEYIRAKANYERQAESLLEKMDELSRRAAVVADVSASDNRWLTATRSFQNPTELTREMLEAMVECIEVTDSENIKVIWKFEDDLALLEACAETGKEDA